MGENAPKVEIMLDKPRNMQFTFGVAKKFKVLMGKEFDELGDKPSFDEVSTLLWLTLQVEDKELTQEQADDLFHIANVQEYIDALDQLVRLSTPEVGEIPKEQVTLTGSKPGPLEGSALD